MLRSSSAARSRRRGKPRPPDQAPRPGREKPLKVHRRSITGLCLGVRRRKADGEIIWKASIQEDNHRGDSNDVY
jgi:hypothetical protein